MNMKPQMNYAKEPAKSAPVETGDMPDPVNKPQAASLTMTNDDIEKMPNGRYRIGKGVPMYRSQAEAEAALKEQQKAQGRKNQGDAPGKHGATASANQGQQQTPPKPMTQTAQWKPASFHDGNVSVGVDVMPDVKG